MPATAAAPWRPSGRPPARSRPKPTPPVTVPAAPKPCRIGLGRTDTALAKPPPARHRAGDRNGDRRCAMLGVLGGMGPMATVDFMGKVVRNTPAARDQEHIPMIVCSAVRIPDRTEAILGRGPDPFPALRQLERAGATRIVIPCNTAHHWHGALQ